MNCLNCEDRMSDYVENALSLAERSAVDRHLQTCPACTDLLANVRRVLTWGSTFPVYEAPTWLPTRIIANTPRVARESWLDTLGLIWKWIAEPRTAMALFTAVLVLSWMGNLAGVSPDWTSVVRNPSAIYYGAQGTLNRAYDGAVRRYYRSPFVSEIRTRIEQLREIS
jgi:anti-sigma factor RsiW